MANKKETTRPERTGKQAHAPRPKHKPARARVHVAAAAPGPALPTWRICKWVPLYGAPVEPGSDAERYALMYPMQYVRLWCGPTTVEGIFVSKQRAAIRAAGGLELIGIADELLRMAACSDRIGGRMVDHLGQPASPSEIAVSIGVSTRQMQTALRVLCGPRIAFVEQTPSVQAGTPVGLRTTARDARTPNRGDGRVGPAGGAAGGAGDNPRSAGERESRQAGGLATGTGSTTAAAPPDGAPADGLPASCGPPGEGGSGGGENRGGTPKDQEQEQEQGQEAGQGQESAAPTEKKKIGMPEGAEGKDPQARPREGENTGTSTSTGTSQPIADVPMVPTGADPGAPGAKRTTADGGVGGVDGGDGGDGVDEAAAQARHVNALTLAVYERIYPSAQFESTEMLKGNDGKGLSARQFRAREHGALASAIAKASAGMTAGQRSELWAWAISTADSVYTKDHRKRRNKPLASVWTWRLNQHRREGRRGAAGGSGPP